MSEQEIKELKNEVKKLKHMIDNIGFFISIVVGGYILLDILFIWIPLYLS